VRNAIVTIDRGTRVNIEIRITISFVVIVIDVTVGGGSGGGVMKYKTFGWWKCFQWIGDVENVVSIPQKVGLNNQLLL
jgi:hypothetical protein